MRGGGESRTGLSQRDLGGGGVPFLCRGGGAIGTFWRSTGVLADGGGVPFIWRGGGGAGTILRGGVLFLFVPLICSGGGVGIGGDGGTAAGGGSGCGFSGAGLTSLAENLCSVDSTVSCHLRWRIHASSTNPIIQSNNNNAPYVPPHVENKFYASSTNIAPLSTSNGDHRPHTQLPILPGRWGTPGALPEGKG